MNRILGFAAIMALVLLIVSSPRCHHSTPIAPAADPAATATALSKLDGPRQLAAFDVVHVRCPVNVIITIGPDSGGLLRADSHQLASIHTDVTDGTLDISGCSAAGDSMPTLQVTVPSLRQLRLAGSNAGTVTVQGLDAETFDINDEGNGDVAVSGRATAVRVYSRGAGNLHLAGLNAEEVHMIHEGSGSVDVTTTRSLVANVSRGGRLEVHSPYSDQLDITLRGNSEANVGGRTGHFSGYLSGGRLQLTDLSVGDLSLRSSGSSSESIINAKDADVWLEGGAVLTLSGSASSLHLRMSSGHAQFHDLRTGAAQVDVAGSGTAEVTVDHALDAIINGSGNIIYDGDPGAVTPHIHGSGQVIHR